MRARHAGTAASSWSWSWFSLLLVSSFRYRKAVSERLNSRAMVCRVSVDGSWPAGMKTRASGLPWNLVWVCFEVGLLVSHLGVHCFVMLLYDGKGSPQGADSLGQAAAKVMQACPGLFVPREGLRC
jgi:hypothetical protein